MDKTKKLNKEEKKIRKKLEVEEIKQGEKK